MLLGQHAKATSRSRNRQAPAGWQGKQDPVEKHPREGSTKVMTFLQPQPEGSKYLFLSKNYPITCWKIIPSTFWKYQKNITACVGNIKKLSQVCVGIIRNLSHVCVEFINHLSPVCVRIIKELSEVYIGIIKHLSRVCLGCNVNYYKNKTG